MNKKTAPGPGSGSIDYPGVALYIRFDTDKNYSPLPFIVNSNIAATIYPLKAS